MEEEEDLGRQDIENYLQCVVEEVELLQAVYGERLETGAGVMVPSLDFLQALHEQAHQLSDAALRTELEAVGAVVVTVAVDVRCHSTAEEQHSDQEAFVELFATLTPYYPREQPVLSLSTSFLSRKEERLLLRSVSAALSPSDDDGMVTRQWICEAAMELVSQVAVLWEHHIDTAVEALPTETASPVKRVWVYFHHIYSKRKKRHIFEWARAAKLNGFLLPGKPGIVCLEGDALDVDLYIQRVRGLSWQKMSVRHSEEFSLAETVEGEEESSMFSSFEERVLSMAHFKAYLEEIGATGMFDQLFFE